MKYIIKPTVLRITMQVFKKGLRYKLIVTKFLENGEVDYKVYSFAYSKCGIKRKVVDVLEDAFFEGISSSEIELSNYTKIKCNLGSIKVHNLR